MTHRSLDLTAIADLSVWRTLQSRIFDVTALRLGLWDADATRVLPPPMPPPACQYVLSDPSRRERCEQFHGAVRAEVRRLQRTTCATCPFGMQYMAVPIQGEGLLAGHWEGGFVINPGPPHVPDASLDAQTWFKAVAVTPHRTATEVSSALALLELLYQQVMGSLALRERRRAQVAQLVSRDLSQALDASHSLEQTLQHFVHLVTQVLGVPIGLLLLRERDTGHLIVGASEGMGDDLIPQTRVRAGEGVAGRVLTSGNPLLVNDVRADATLGPLLPPMAKVRAVLAVPVRQLGEVDGVIKVGSYAPNAFNADDVGLVSLLAELVEGLLSQDPHRNLPDADMGVLSENLKAMTAAMQEGSQAPALLEQIMDLVIKVMRASSASLRLVDHQDHTLRLACARGPAADLMPIRVPLGEGALGWVAQSGEPLCLPNVATDGRYATVREDLRSELAVPLLSDGEVLGVIQVSAIAHHYFSEFEIDMVKMLAALTVLALKTEHATGSVTRSAG